MNKVMHYRYTNLPEKTWTCSETARSACSGLYQYCSTLYKIPTVYTEGVSADSLPTVSGCKYGNRVEFRRTDEIFIDEIVITKEIRR